MLASRSSGFCVVVVVAFGFFEIAASLLTMSTWIDVSLEKMDSYRRVGVLQCKRERVCVRVCE